MTHDVVVIGAGPAGTSCSLKLTRYGFQVLLLARADEKRQHVGESLPSSIRVVLGDLGIELPPEVVVERPPAHLVFWGEMQGGTPWTGLSERESSLLVWRGPFDRFLRERAAAGGVRLVEAAAKRVRRDREGIAVETTGGSEHRARFVVDASGRAGIVARMHRRRERGFRTLALTAHFRTGEESPPTLVEAFEDGWVWSAPLANGLRDVTVTVDGGARTAERHAIFSSALARADHARSLVAGAAVEGPIRGIDTTPYHAARSCGNDFLLVGDAASFLDPLSAHGVHKAMDGALAAAVVVRSILERPARIADAREFYEERERSIYRITTERLRALYRQETRFASRPFWRSRSGDASVEPARAVLRPLNPNAVLRASSAVRVAEAPVLENDYVERREVLLAPGRERPVRFHGSVCLPDVYREVLSAGSAYQAALRSKFGFERAFAAIEWLYRWGYLEDGSSES